jgi:hypothetical protein
MPSTGEPCEVSGAGCTDFQEGSKGCAEVDLALPDGFPHLGEPRLDLLGG